jgi:hypothetical protein
MTRVLMSDSATPISLAHTALSTPPLGLKSIGGHWVVTEGLLRPLWMFSCPPPYHLGKRVLQSLHLWLTGEMQMTTCSARMLSPRIP